MATVQGIPIQASEIPDRDLRVALTAWFTQRGDSADPPIIDQLDPFIVPALAPSAIFYDVAEDDSLTLRIAGDNVRALLGYNPAGKPVEEVVGEGAYGRYIAAQLQDCARRGLPIFAHHDYVSSDRERARKSMRIALPYRDGDRVCKLLCFQKFSDYIEYLRIAVPGEDAWSDVKLAFVDGV